MTGMRRSRTKDRDPRSGNYGGMKTLDLACPRTIALSLSLAALGACGDEPASELDPADDMAESGEDGSTGDQEDEAENLAPCEDGLRRLATVALEEPSSGEPPSLGYDPESSRVVWAAGRSLTVVDVTDPHAPAVGAPVDLLGPDGEDLYFSDGRNVIVTDGRVFISDSGTVHALSLDDPTAPAEVVDPEGSWGAGSHADWAIDEHGTLAKSWKGGPCGESTGFDSPECIVYSHPPYDTQHTLLRVTKWGNTDHQVDLNERLLTGWYDGAVVVQDVDEPEAEPLQHLTAHELGAERIVAAAADREHVAIATNEGLHVFPLALGPHAGWHVATSWFAVPTQLAIIDGELHVTCESNRGQWWRFDLGVDHVALPPGQGLSSYDLWAIDGEVVISATKDGELSIVETCEE